MWRVYVFLIAFYKKRVSLKEAFVLQSSFWVLYHLFNMRNRVLLHCHSMPQLSSEHVE